MPELNYGGNLNYPNYGMTEQAMEPYAPSAQYPSYQPNSGVSSMVSDVANMASGPTMAFNPLVGTGLKAISLGASIYDKYQQRDAAKKNYESMLAEYNRRQKVETEDRAIEQARQARQESYFASDFAQDVGADRARAYKGYRQPQGM